ncbi:IS1 family transposase [Azospirillum canadense]|uniref:IS1 family transposase n=1 Tax=Azospirillum canadense TaxID=403962 RepID=UPI002227ED2E|nr:IS1 family transposase [Azospirillum canadense]MCW2243137.1 hypothetical protein [Azospirillum canadense]
MVKSGHVLGKQRWLCRRCGFQFTRLPDIPVPEPTKQAAVTLSGHGLSLRAVGKLLGTTGQSVLRWVCQSVDRHCSKPTPEPVTVIAIDEMWHDLGGKAQKLWIWKAYDRDSGRLIDWECGKRDEATFRRLYERLQCWGACLFCTDQFAVSDAVLPVSGGIIRARTRVSPWSATIAASGIGSEPAAASRSSSPRARPW